MSNAQTAAWIQGVAGFVMLAIGIRFGEDDPRVLPCALVGALLLGGAGVLWDYGKEKS